MKVREIRLTIKDRKTVFKELANAWEKIKNREKMEPHEEISFENIDTLRKVLTPKRMELLHAIKHNRPESLYELAQMVERDLKSVNTDIEVLVTLGLVLLEKTNDERKKTKPLVEFDKLNVEIEI
ncbi:MAG TPA: hypothetical protein VJH22_06910 [Candidatus Nanoarchaeia archaeon]|nr:hypothetical protein [Candidatus Nanoarchaeia archaeon]